MTELATAILAALTGCHAQKPMQFDTLLGLMPKGTSSSHLEAALDALFDTRQIQRIRHERDGFAWVEVWPTGIIGAAPTWKPLDTQRTPPVLPERETTPAKEPPMKSYIPSGASRRMLDIVIERGPIKGLDLANLSDFPIKQLHSRAKALIDHKVLVRERVGHLTWYMTPEQRLTFEPASCKATPKPNATSNLKPAAKPKEETLPAEHQAIVETVGRLADGESRQAAIDVGAAIADQVNEIADKMAGFIETERAKRQGMMFLIADDASLTIVDDGEIMRIPPDEACRLAEFLQDCAPVFEMRRV